MKKLALSLLLLLTTPLWSQNVRWDYAATTTLSTSGTLVPVMAIRNAPISFYTGCTSLPCLTHANVFPTSTSVSPCGSSTQVVLQDSITCQATADPSGNFGGYFLPGHYQYTIFYANNTYGPFVFDTPNGSTGAYVLPIATTLVLGGVKPDGTSCTVNGTTGVLSCAASGSSVLINGVSLPTVNFNNTIPSADANYTLALWKQTSSNVSVEYQAINQLTGDIVCGPGNGSQSCTLPTVNSSPGTCGDASHTCQITSNGKGLITNQTQVSINTGFTSGNTINGRWVQDPTGTITERGQITVTQTGATLATSTITFPLTFPTAVDSLVITAGQAPAGGGSDSNTYYYTSLTTSGSGITIRCSVNIGGSGCSNIGTNMPISWIAIGR